LYFETGAGDGFREPRFSKERRLDPQITIGLLTGRGHHQRDSIEAHLTIVLAALAVSRWTEHAPGRPIRKFVRTARRYRTIEIQARAHVITAADPCRATSMKPSAAPPGFP
jgi:hypothetical protein